MTNSQSGQADQSNPSWQAEYLKEALRKGEINVKFVKKDGSERDMRCTLNADLLPPEPVQEHLDVAVQPQKAVNPDVLKVWDLDKNAWRSFRLESIIGFSEQYNGIS